jgi:transcriptional regulator with XRE-family HTH domain
MATDSWQRFGDLLRRSRLAAGLTQEELAARAGLSVRGLSDLERGARLAPRRETVQLLAEALQLTSQERLAFVKAATSHRSRSAVAAADDATSWRGPLSPLLGRRDELALL